VCARPGTLAWHGFSQLNCSASAVLGGMPSLQMMIAAGLDSHAGAGSSLFQPPRLIAEGVNVDPLGSFMIGARVFPDKFRGLVAMGRAVLTVTPLEE